VLYLKSSFILVQLSPIAMADKPTSVAVPQEALSTSASEPRPKPPLRRVFLVGHPNVGKSAVFSLLTGEYAFVSNYPGTTVEVTRGTWHRAAKRIEVADTPGVNSLAAHSDEEWVTVDMLRRERPDVLVQVADAKNLRRSLLLTLQLAELGLPLVLALNMMDEAEKLGMRIDTAALAADLGMEVVPMVAPLGVGREALQSAIEQARVPGKIRTNGLPVHRNGSGAASDLHSTPAKCTIVTCPAFGRGPGGACGFAVHGNRASNGSVRRGGLADAWRQRAAQALAERVLQIVEPSPRRWVERLDGWLRRPATGWPILVAILALTYLFVGVGAAQWAVGWLDAKLFGQWVIPGVKWFLAALGAGPPAGGSPSVGVGPFLNDLLIGRFGAISMGLTYALAILLPILVGFFLLFGWLEDSGYLPRLAILADRQLRRFGLNGKAVLPLVLGLGCDTMATMVTRVLSTRKERLIATLVLAVGIPCSAQLGVVMGLLAGSSLWGMVTVVATVGSQVLLVAYGSSKLLPGKQSDFILEIPPLRMPRWSNLLRKTALRVRWFFGEALPFFVFGAVLLFFLDRWGWLQKITAAGQPIVVDWLGLPADAATALLMGFLRRDYGAAGLFALARAGQLDAVQVVVAAVTLTLFLPCLANLLMIVKEFGGRAATAMALFVIPFALFVGGVLNHLLRWLLPALGFS
jgi:ferrous iron transport protein B